MPIPPAPPILGEREVVTQNAEGLLVCATVDEDHGHNKAKLSAPSIPCKARGASRTSA
jgi:hypothetical protein